MNMIFILPLPLSIYKTNAYKVTEQNLRILKSCHQQFIKWVLQQFLIHFSRVQKHISIDLNLDCQNGNLVRGNFQLVWLAVKTKAVDWLSFLFSERAIFLVSGSDESKLNVGIEITTQVLEWQLELLNSLTLLHSKGNQLRIGIFIVQLLHALDPGIVKVAQEQHLNFPLDNHWDS